MKGTTVPTTANRLIEVPRKPLRGSSGRGGDGGGARIAVSHGHLSDGKLKVSIANCWRRSQEEGRGLTASAVAAA